LASSQHQKLLVSKGHSKIYWSLGGIFGAPTPKTDAERSETAKIRRQVTTRGGDRCRHLHMRMHFDEWPFVEKTEAEILLPKCFRLAKSPQMDILTQDLRFQKVDRGFSMGFE
jgi:hypothetical protein